jgi:DNA-binding transcriptional MerR regulator
MKISELAERTGVSAHALRHYERLGLLEPERRPNGYRDYPEAMRREVIFIAMSRRIGFSLKSIAERLPAYRAGRLGFAEMEEAMRGRIAEIDAEIGALRAQRRQVVEHIAWLHEQKKLRERQRRSPPATAKPWPQVRGRRNTKEPA